MSTAKDIIEAAVPGPPRAPAAENEFQAELGRRIDGKIKELRKDGTTSMGMRNLVQMVDPPPAHPRSSPSSPYSYLTVFRRVVDENPKRRAFVIGETDVSDPGEFQEPRNNRCPYCYGSGSIAVEPGSTTRYRCPDCKGSGLILDDDDDTEEDDDDAEEEVVEGSGNPHRAFNVFLDGKLIDTVFYGHNVNVDVDEVKKSLINHDGYPSNITVKERPQP